jgi:predicted signal transduction protein with EAL and GGDEF domain
MSLRSRLLCLVLLAILLPALMLGQRFHKETEAEIAGAVRNLSLSSNNIAAALDQRVLGTAQLGYGLAHSRLLDSAERGLCSAYLSAVREAYPQYTGIVSVLPDGQLHCDSLQSGRVVNLSDRNYVKRVQAGATGVLTEPAFGRLTGKAVLQVVYPARSDTGALRFMLVASLNLQSFADEARQQSLLEAADLLLLDDKGTVLTWVGATDDLPKPGTSLAGTPLFTLSQTVGTVETVGRDGLPHVWAVADSPILRAAGVRVMLGQPQRLLVAASERHLHEGLLILTGAALLLFAGVWFLAERGIRRPLLRITSMVRSLGEGKLSARIEKPYASGELGGLMSALNSMADSLEQQRAAIDELTNHLREAHGREISERKSNEEQLTRMANFDGLTGLPNRTLFRDRLQRAITRSRRSSKQLALMFLDVDRFKIINDSLGHGVGDQLLVAMASVLVTCLRGSDTLARYGGPEAAEEVFRLGGDEFMILAEDVDETHAADIARRVLSMMARPIKVGEHELFITASIGITLTGDASVNLDGLIKQADMAMYRAKELGRDAFCFFEEKMNLAAIQRHETEVCLRQALERGEFQLHYQPKADMRTSRVTGVEALLRWKPAGKPLVAPDHFIAILEETGLIVPVGAWVFREACGQMMKWQRAGMRPLQIAVNVSAKQFRHPELVQHIARVLDETGLDPALLEVELTESMLIDDSDVVARNMAELGRMGVGIAIDDFGTGQSSLRYLKRFTIDTLKIDRSFVKDTPDDPEDSAITKAVIALGHGLGLKVVAEGVETQEQLDFLCTHGCDQLQGYLLSRPVDADAFSAWFCRRETSQPLWLLEPASP